MSLQKKIHAILSEGLKVGKRGTNNFHKYSYTTEADVVEAAREALVKHGLVYSYTMEDVQQITPEMCRVKIRFTLSDFESGEKLESVVFGDGSDKGDKGVPKAITMAQKYYFMKTFLAATGDDAEADTDTDKRAAAAPKSVPAPTLNISASSGVSTVDTGAKHSKWRSLKTATTDSEY